MKRNINIDNPLPALQAGIRDQFFGDAGQRIYGSCLRRIYGFLKEETGYRKIIISFLFVTVSLTAGAPGVRAISLPDVSPLNPFASLMYAIGMVETMGNTMAYNPRENAAGIFQIRQVRVDEYNRLTGNHYTLYDMFDRAVSEKVFLYFASKIGPYNLEKIAKAWNGSGPKTEFYWKRIREYL